jgi:hypothetical protein
MENLPSNDLLDEESGRREEKAARNQALFRSVNEQIRRLQENGALLDDFGPLAPIKEWVCECADTGCVERITLSVEEYAAVRSSGSRFAVAAGDAHYLPDVEKLTEKHENYWVVEKIGRAKEIADVLYEREQA